MLKRNPTEICIEDIPAEGLAIDATEADEWFLELLGEATGGVLSAGDRAALHVTATRVEGTVTLGGELEFDAHSTCDRCLKSYAEHQRLLLRTVLAPLSDGSRPGKGKEELEADLVLEDLDFAFYEGDRFDLAQIVREQAMLAQPMKHLCSEGCRGLCQHCGKDLNEGPCRCPEKITSPRWNVLKGVILAPRRPAR